jgi:hypothetical protein
MASPCHGRRWHLLVVVSYALLSEWPAMSRSPRTALTPFRHGRSHGARRRGRLCHPPATGCAALLSWPALMPLVVCSAPRHGRPPSRPSLLAATSQHQAAAPSHACISAVTVGTPRTAPIGRPSTWGMVACWGTKGAGWLWAWEMADQYDALAELERRRAECLALAANESDLYVKGGLLAQAASLRADIREAKRRKAYSPRALRTADIARVR